MGFIYTKEQTQVIELRNRNILVSAAAGSGKTAVLVERIVSKISNPDKPVDIDRLLVVTFTKAAASEMRERVSIAINKKLDEMPENEYLQKQATLLHNAQITTIDSFCLYIIRNHFEDIGLNPDFRVADEGECKLLEQDALSQVLEEYFANGDGDFLRMVECYSTGGHEKNVEELVLGLYRFAMSYPWPVSWLLRCKADYKIDSEEQILNEPWMKTGVREIKARITECSNQLKIALTMCRESDGPYIYEELLNEELTNIELLGKCDEYEALAEVIKGITFGRLPSKKDESISTEKRELVKRIRNGVKETIIGIRKRYFSIKLEQTIKDQLECAPAIGALIDVTISFMECFTQIKQAKNVIDFGDIEHYALNILIREVEGEAVPTKTAIAYRDYFEEILIDEYQDSNLVQEYLLSAVSGEEDNCFNRFMVGDVKQSIYKFRLARPELFMEKYHSYKPEESNKQRIDLHKNFRSRGEVLSGVNYIFYQIMREELGGVLYDDKAALYPGAAYLTDKSNYETEVLLAETKPKEADAEASDLVDKEALETAGIKTASEGTDFDADGISQDSELGKIDSKKKLEAQMIANKIHELVGIFQVQDKESNVLRPARYGDIVILLRTNSGWDEEFKQILTLEGIPAYITSRTGYFSAVEIKTTLNYLKILDNPLQDIPLYGVLQSPMGGFTKSEMAMIRKKTDWSLYESLENYMENGENEHLAEKVAAFLQSLRDYRNKVPYTKVHDLIYLIISETQYYDYVGALPAGEQRRANLNMLLEKAQAFEQTSYSGLFQFVRYIEQLNKYEVDYGEAGTNDSRADIVRIMSIHKSKGLEFPICFVAGMSKQFNMQDTNKAVILDMDFGIGTDYINPVERTKTATLRKSMMSDKMHIDILAEELRILYVALTRAKEKLFITGTIPSGADVLSKYASVLNVTDIAMPYGILSSAKSYLDFILPALMRHSSAKKILAESGVDVSLEKVIEDEAPIIVSIIQADRLKIEKAERGVKALLVKEHLLTMESMVDEKDKLYTDLQSKLTFEYPYKNLSNLYTKTTVSELKMAAYHSLLETEEKEDASYKLIKEESVMPCVPKFMQDKETASGSDRGSAYHKVMEMIVFGSKRIDNDVTSEMKQLAEDGKLPYYYLELVNPDKIKTFLGTRLAARMGVAEDKMLLRREQPFVLGIPASRVDPDFPEKETVLIQGIIDIFFEEDGNLILMDYKTDRVNTPEELIKRYKAQLDYYADALTQLTGKSVAEKIIYSFALEKEISLI